MTTGFANEHGRSLIQSLLQQHVNLTVSDEQAGCLWVTCKHELMTLCQSPIIITVESLGSTELGECTRSSVLNALVRALTPYRAWPAEFASAQHAREFTTEVRYAIERHRNLVE